MYLIVLGWLYVALMMAVAEASHPRGGLLGALVTFVLYGAAPVLLLVYLMKRPARRAARRLQEAQETREVQEARVGAAEAAVSSGAPDAGGQPSADAVPPVRKEP